MGLSRVGQAGLQLWDPVACGHSFCSFGPESPAGPAGSAALGLSGTAGLSAALGLARGHGQPVHGFGTESRGWPVHRLRPVHGAASLCTWCAPTRGFSCGRPAGVSVVGPQSADQGAPNRASGERRGCLSGVHCPGAERGGVPEAAAAAESSLTSH